MSGPSKHVSLSFGFPVVIVDSNSFALHFGKETGTKKCQLVEIYLNSFCHQTFLASKLLPSNPKTEESLSNWGLHLIIYAIVLPANILNKETQLIIQNYNTIITNINY